MAPAGTPIEMRAILPTTPDALRSYEVVKPLPVLSGNASPWFDQVGGGMQFVSPKNGLASLSIDKDFFSIDYLVEDGYLKRLP